MQSLFYDAKELFPGIQIMSQRALKNINTWDKSALLASMAAVCPVLAATQKLSRGYCAHFHGCFECLSPHETAA